MAKKKITKKDEPKVVHKHLDELPVGDFKVSSGWVFEEAELLARAPITELNESFGNGELNVLRDKINEVIKRINE